MPTPNPHKPTSKPGFTPDFPDIDLSAPPPARTPTPTPAPSFPASARSDRSGADDLDPMAALAGELAAMRADLAATRRASEKQHSFQFWRRVVPLLILLGGLPILAAVMYYLFP